MDQEKIEELEYEALCADWRYRDEGLWKCLAVSATLTGAAFFAAFNGKLAYGIKTIIFFISFSLNWVLLLAIVKFHYYRIGSSEQLFRMNSKWIDPKLDPRIYKPTVSFLKNILDSFSSPEKSSPASSFFYWLFCRVCMFSASKWFFGIQVFLVLLSLVFSGYCFLGWWKGWPVSDSDNCLDKIYLWQLR